MSGSGPIVDQLVRKAYVAGYDRRLRHPAWVRHAVQAPTHFLTLETDSRTPHSIGSAERFWR